MLFLIASFPTVAQHLEDVRVEVASYYRDLKCEPWSPPLAAMSRLRCGGHSPRIGPDEYVTYIGLQELSGWWFKLRATAQAAEQEASEDALTVLLGQLTIPFPPAATGAGARLTPSLGAGE